MFPLCHYCLPLNKTIPHYSTKDNPRLLQMLQPPVYLRLTHNRLLRHTQMDSYKIYILLAEFFSLQSCIQSLSGQDTPILTRVKIVQRLQGNIFLNVINLYLQNFVTSHTYFAKLIIFSIFIDVECPKMLQRDLLRWNVQISIRQSFDVVHAKS